VSSRRSLPRRSTRVFERVATAIDGSSADNWESSASSTARQRAACDDVPCGCGGDEATAEPSRSPRGRRAYDHVRTVSRVNDAAREPMRFPLDAFLIERACARRCGSRSGWGAASAAVSGRAASSPTPSRRSIRLLRPIAALLGSAVEHWRIWDAERRRRERLEQLESRLGALRSLDVRQIFARVSEGLRQILRTISSSSPRTDTRRRTLRIIAAQTRPTLPCPTCRCPDGQEARRARTGPSARRVELSGTSERDACCSPPACVLATGAGGPATAAWWPRHLLPTG
jgi:hypothetical protein